MASLSLKNINKVYPNGFEAVKDFSLVIRQQEQPTKTVSL